MSLYAELANDAKALAARLENVDHEALNTLEAVQSNPATAQIFTIIGQLTHLPPTELATGISVLEMVLRLGAGQAPGQPQAAPAGPQVAGQA
jgi:hypothetical protein